MERTTTPTSRPLLATACLTCASLLGVAGAGLPAAAATSGPPPTDPAATAAPTTGDEGGEGGGAIQVDGATVGIAAEDGTAVAVTPEAASSSWRPAGARLALDATDPGLAFRAEVDAEGVAVIAEIGERFDGRELGFDVEVPSGHVLQPADDGGIDVVGPGGLATTGFAAPWAHDAEGRSVATRYALDGERIVQEIDLDEDTAYPVTADPKLTTGWVTGTVYFDIPETIEIGDTSWFSSACAGLARLGPVGAAVAVACAVAWNSVAYTARRARREGKCLKLKFPLTIVTGAGVVTPGTYRGGYCTK